MLLTPIPHSTSFQWDKIANIPLSENNDPLIIVDSHSRLRVVPIYHQLGIAHATEQIWLRKTLIQKLHEALSYLPEQYGFEILDGWRPLVVQAALRDNFRQQIIQQHLPNKYNSC